MQILAFLGAAFPSIVAALFLGGLVAAVIFFVMARGHRPKAGRTALLAWLIFSLLAFGGMAVDQAYTTIKYGTVGLVVRFGALTGQVFEPGLHWKVPFIDQITIVPTVVQSYETSNNPAESNADYRDYPVTAQTVDGQQISIRYTVLFHIPADKAVSIVQNVGYINEVVENVVKAYSRNLARLMAQSYTAEDLYSGEGIFSYEEKVQESLVEEFKKYGVVLDDFLVRKVDFGEEYVNAIEQQQIAQEAIETARYNAEAAEFEKQRQVRLAEAEAERTKLLAQADAERQRLLADAEAYSIETQGKMLAQYPQIIQWEFIHNLQNVSWGILPSDSVTPFLPLPSPTSPITGVMTTP